MNLKPADLERLLKAGNGAALPSLILLYGDDSGVVRQLTKGISTLVCPTGDPFQSDRLDNSDLQENAGRLLEAATTISFGGGRRLVVVDGVMGNSDKNQLDKVKEAVALLLEDLPAEAVVVLPVPGLDAKHGLATLVNRHKQAAAVRCFVDNTRDLRRVITEQVAEAQQKIAPEALQFLLDNLGNDRGVTASELDKLMLYTQGQSVITLDDCLAVVAAAPSVNVFKLCDAIGSRDINSADRYLESLRQEGSEMNMVLAMVMRHLRRLRQCHQLMAAGSSADQAMSALRPPIAPFARTEFGAQLRAYPAARLNQISTRLYELQRDSRQSGVDSELILRRGILGLAA